MRTAPVLASCLLACSLLLGSRPLAAEPVGSPAGILKKGQWFFGLIGGGLAGRELADTATANLFHVSHVRGYGLTDRISLYGKIGAAYLQVDDSAIRTVASGSTEHTFGTNVLAAAQLKARLWRHAKTGVEWDGSLQYAYLGRRTSDSNQPKWQEWQGATSVAKSWGRLKPYLGLKVSLVSMDYRIREGGQTTHLGSYKGDATVGPFFGSDMYLGDSEDLVMNIETSYINGGGEVTMAIGYSF